MESIWITKEKSGNEFKLNILKIGILMSSRILAEKGISGNMNREREKVKVDSHRPSHMDFQSMEIRSIFAVCVFLEVVKDIHTLSC